MSWESVKIGDICNVGDGAHASIKRTPKGIPYYSSKNFKIDGIDLSKVDYISEEDYKKHFRSNSNAITKPLKNDILLSIIGSIGAPHLVDEEDDFGLSSSVSIIRPNLLKIEASFLYYWIKSDDFQNAVHQIKSGVAQSFLSLSMIKQLPVVYPKSLETQKRIASILSAYDDLIENNLKRIKLLEETAQNIYKEWFVHFRFPNYEHTVFDGESGLPVGWERKLADDIYNINIGKTPPREETQWFSNGDGIKWVSIADINKSTVFVSHTKERITKEGVHKFNMRIANEGSVLLSFKLTVGAVVIASEDVVTNEAIAHFNILEDSILSKEYTYCFLKDFNYQTLGSTSSIGTSINSKIVKSMKIVFPAENVISEFTQSVKGVFIQIQNLTFQNQKLKEARDILLPRLMNRTIEV